MSKNLNAQKPKIVPQIQNLLTKLFKKYGKVVNTKTLFTLIHYVWHTCWERKKEGNKLTNKGKKGQKNHMKITFGKLV